MQNRELFSGLIRLHILHHAARKPLFGSWLIEELGHHGYRLSPGTLYPILHSMERKGYLRSRSELVEGHRRRVYEITARGRVVLAEARQKVQELFGEMFEDGDASE